MPSPRVTSSNAPAPWRWSRAEACWGVLLNVGGDLRVVGEAPRTLGIVSPWADSESSEPIALVEVKNRAVATSGRSQRGFQIDGKWHSHIFDPRSGLPATGVASATVIAPRSADADALATIFNVLSPEQSLRLAKTLPDVRLPDRRRRRPDHAQRRLASLREGGRGTSACGSAGWRGSRFPLPDVPRPTSPLPWHQPRTPGTRTSSW